MGKTNIDMWYGDKPEQVTGLDIYFNDLGGFYSGNLRIFGKIVGDYYADSVQDIEKAFPHLAKNIENCLNQPPQRMPAGSLPAAVFPLRDNIKNMEIENMRFCGHLKDGTQLLLTDDEIINNALKQEKQGIKPHYCFYDYKEEKATTPPGWLIWSLHDGGCGVVYRRDDGKMIINAGMQGDFCYI